MRAENSLIWSEYDDSDFTTAHFGGAAWTSNPKLRRYEYDTPCQVVLFDKLAPGHTLQIVAWSDGKGNSHELPLIKDLIDMKGQKRDQFEMAGDCLGAVFRFWSRADSKQRDMLANQMIVDLKLPASLFYAMDEVIPSPDIKKSANNACTDFYRGFTNRLYAKGKRREDKRPLLDSHPQGPQEACRQIYKRAADYIRGILLRIMASSSMRMKLSTGHGSTSQSILCWLRLLMNLKPSTSLHHKVCSLTMVVLGRFKALE